MIPYLLILSVVFLYGATFQAFRVSLKKLPCMKIQLCIAAVSILITFACSKSNTDLPEDNGCIERVTVPVTAHSIDNSDIAKVNNLFTNNGIDNSKFRYFQYVHDTFHTLYPPYTSYDEQMIRVDQYTNGLRIFSSDLLYLFWDGSLHYRGGNITNGTSLNTSPKLTLGQIRKLFLDDIEKFDHTGARFNDSCFRAEFGYYNLNTGTNNSQEVLVKVWHVTPKIHSYPEAYYMDSDGKLIYYFNGIMTFK